MSQHCCKKPLRHSTSAPNLHPDLRIWIDPQEVRWRETAAFILNTGTDGRKPNGLPFLVPILVQPADRIRNSGSGRFVSVHLRICYENNEKQLVTAFYKHYMSSAKLSRGKRFHDFEKSISLSNITCHDVRTYHQWAPPPGGALGGGGTPSLAKYHLPPPPAQVL